RGRGPGRYGAKVHVIDHVEHLPPELHRLRAGELEGPGQREVVLEVARVDDRERPQIAVGAGRWRGEGGAIQILRRRSAAVWIVENLHRTLPAEPGQRVVDAGRDGAAVTALPTDDRRRLPVGEECAQQAIVLEAGRARHQRQVDDMAAVG